MGLARGGVVVAVEVAKVLHCPLNVIVIRKIGAPGREELALGAITDEGKAVYNDSLISILGVSSEFLEKESARQKQLAKDRMAYYQGVVPVCDIKGKTILLVDDGIATGASMRMAALSVREKGARKIVVAVPVGSSDTLKKLEKEVEEVVCPHAPHFFDAVGSFYQIFDQVSDEEIIRIFSTFSAR